MAINTSVTPIIPTNNLKILRSVSLDDTYSDTFSTKFFSNKENQAAWFAAKAKYQFNNFGPFRMQEQIRVPVNASLLYDCNYIMFQNTNWSGKWFYAFITEIHFENVNLSTISFKIDVMQTWLFEMDVQRCFVAREHIESDVIGSNLVPENFELGEYVVNGAVETSGAFSNWGVGIASAYEASGAIADGSIIARTYTGLALGFFNSEQIGTLNQWIKKLVNDNKQDGIVALYMLPSSFYSRNVEPVRWNSSTAKNYGALDGYAPRNAKLYTYPYNFLLVTNYTGNTAEYHYEWFADGECQYEVVGDCSPSASFLFSPKNYKNVTGANYNETISLTGLPQCSFTSDSYKAWLAQNQSSLNMANLANGLSFAGGIAGAAAGAATGNPIMLAAGAQNVLSGVNGALGTMAKVTDAKAHPAHVRSNQVNNAMYAAGNFEFGLYKMSISQEFARMIDGFFDMYGYATNELKIPNMTSRPSWNYVKTDGAKVIGRICFDHLALIKKILDNGITFWHGDFIGKYNRTNR